MYLQPLGVYGPFANNGHACSGYLVGDGETHVLLDCGSGVVARLLSAIDLTKLSAVVLSHLHGDHMSDMFILKYALTRVHHKIPVFLPSEPQHTYELLAHEERYKTDTAENFSIGALNFSLHPMLHPVATRGVCITSGGKKLFYTGDSVSKEALFEPARDADLFLCDAWALGDTIAPHMSAAEAAALAKNLNVKQLILTHLDFRNDAQAYLDEARPIFPNAVVVEEMQRYEV